MGFTRLLPKSRVIGGYAAAIVVALMGLLAYRSARQSVVAFDTAHRATALLETIRDVGTQVQNAEAGQREYLITGDEEALAPYHDAAATSETMSTRLRTEALPFPPVGPRVDSLVYFLRLRLGELGQAARVRYLDGYDAGVAALEIDRSQPTRAEFHRLSATLYSDLEAQLASQLRGARRARDTAGTLAVIAALMAIGLAWLTNLMYRQHTQEQRRTYEELEQQSNELQLQAAELEAANSELELTTREMVQQAVEAEGSELRLAGILGSAFDAIVSYDDEHRIIYFNTAAERMLGVRAEQAVGKQITDFLPESVHELFDDRMGTVRLARHVSSGAAHRWETVVLSADGSEVPVEISVAYARAVKQGMFTAILRDVSSQHQLEAQLRQAQKMEAVGRLAGGIAHDFNNLLTVIGASSDFLLQSRTSTPEELREDVMEIRRATDRAAALTRQLLAFSRRQLVQPELVDLNSVIADMETMLRRLIGEDIKLQTACDNEPSVVRIDRGQLEQVIVNLVVNARDAMPQGGLLSITVGPAPDTTLLAPSDDVDGVQEEIRECVAITVRDTGIGMNQDIQSRIFEPFFTTKEQGKGTGLGLPTVYGIVKQSGGDVSVHSEVGEGTEFRLFFPRAKEELPSSGDASSLPDAVRGHETILLVEDEEALRRLARRILESRGYTVLDAANGREAIDVMARHGATVDLLLSDIVMPTMGGRELVERLLPVYPLLRVLFMSGYTEDMMLQHRIAELGIKVLEKPFTPEALAWAVRSTLDQEPDRRTRLADAASA